MSKTCAHCIAEIKDMQEYVQVNHMKPTMEGPVIEKTFNYCDEDCEGRALCTVLFVEQ